MHPCPTTALTASDVIATASAFVALCALGVAVWTGWLQRRHNMLSVRPHIDIIVTTSQEWHLIVQLRNTGLGPAQLVDIQATFDGRTVRLDSSGTFSALIAHVVRDANVDTQYLVKDSHTGLPAGDSLQLLGIKFLDKEPTDLTELVDQLGDIQYRIEFQCMYGNKYRLETPKRAA